MSTNPTAPKNGYTWNDYQTWIDERRWEIVGGEAFDMTPAPLVRHQHVSGKLFNHLSRFFAGNPCHVYHAPIDLKLSEIDIVQPDLIVVCDSRQLTRTHIEGPPALVIEITSDSSLAHDRIRKSQLYARCGIPEYWVVTPYPALVEIFTLRDRAYVLQAGFESADTLHTPSFPGLEIPLAGVFDFPVDPDEVVHVIKESRPPYAPRAPLA